MVAEAPIVNFALTKGLQGAFGRIIMPLEEFPNRAFIMPTSSEKHDLLTPEERAAVLDPFSHPEGFVSLWQKAGARAVENARQENAALGIDSPCTHNGQTGVLTPSGKFIAKDFTP